MQIRKVIGIQGKSYPSFGGVFGFVFMRGERKAFWRMQMFKLGTEKWVEGSQLPLVGGRKRKSIPSGRTVTSRGSEMRARGVFEEQN